MLFKNAINLFIVFAEIRNLNYATCAHSGLPHLNSYSVTARERKQRLTEVGEIFPGWRPIPARVLASSAAFTPQFGATFAWQRMCTFILQTAGKRREPRSDRSRSARCRRNAGTESAAAERGRPPPTLLTHPNPGHFHLFLSVQKQKASVLKDNTFQIHSPPTHGDLLKDMHLNHVEQLPRI